MILVIFSVLEICKFENILTKIIFPSHVRNKFWDTMQYEYHVPGIHDPGVDLSWTNNMLGLTNGEETRHRPDIRMMDYPVSPTAEYQQI